MRVAMVLLLGWVGCAPAVVGAPHGVPRDVGAVSAADAGAFVPDAGSDAPVDAPVDAGEVPPMDAGVTPPPDAGCVRPTALNTGVPAGTVLTVVLGDLTISKAGAIVEGVEVSGDVLIAANDVVLRNSRIHGGVEMAPNARRGTVDHSELGPDTGGYPGTALMLDHSFQLLYSNLHNFRLAVRPQFDVLLRGNYLHAPYGKSGDATGGVAGYGVSGPGGVTLECNDIDVTTPASGSQVDLANDVFEVTCTDTVNPPQGLSLSHNWFGGAGYAVYIWGFWGTLDVKDNVWDGHAAYGPVWFNGDTAMRAWSGNGYADGGTLKTPEVISGKNCEG